jgi:cytochrome c-type protein NapB
MLTKTTVATMLLIFTVVAGAQQGVGMTDAMRGPTPIDQESSPPPLVNQENKDVRRTRAFAWQPPTIPHRIDGYQIDRSANRCMFCHARSKIEESKAIPLSMTHYMDRDGTLRGDVSPRRYFCTSCHVPQDEVKPLIGNTFVDFDAARTAPAAGAGKGTRAPVK